MAPFITYHYIERKYLQLVQANSKQEKEQLKRQLELVTKEKDMYKRERENLTKDNNRLRASLQDTINQNNMLKRQVSILEQQEDVSNDQKVDTIKEQLDYEIERLKRQLTAESDKSRRFETMVADIKVGKDKADKDKSDIERQLKDMTKMVQQLTDQKRDIEMENEGLKSKLSNSQSEANRLRESHDQISKAYQGEVEKVEQLKQDQANISQAESSASSVRYDSLNEQQQVSNDDQTTNGSYTQSLDNTQQQEFIVEQPEIREPVETTPPPQTFTAPPIQKVAQKPSTKPRQKIAASLFETPAPTQPKPTPPNLQNASFNQNNTALRQSPNTINMQNHLNQQQPKPVAVPAQPISHPTPVQQTPSDPFSGQNSSQNAADFFNDLYESSNQNSLGHSHTQREPVFEPVFEPFSNDVEPR